ncbi:hypothetical protein M407DRAFT_241077 [Tulasnella calospora MUT 4182]|uniref:Uncharacterized protein n=1 Tax=Tulasnella calospora MUT 4182 TaxID=1051891 RepID=A0A0C3MHR2_9AGAM|nr:hypothetical protein M407DRAFT_241077 [Tulasnella calospora MUT 4182]
MPLAFSDRKGLVQKSKRPGTLPLLNPRTEVRRMRIKNPGFMLESGCTCMHSNAAMLGLGQLPRSSSPNI